ncbi:neo-calmodulin-like [Crassostrea virginica]
MTRRSMDSRMSVDRTDVSFQSITDLALEARSVFDDFDKDKSGHIDAAELGNSLRVFGLNPTMKEIYDMINEVDKNGNGTIEFDEFLAFLKRSYRKPDEIKLDLKKAFRILDINGDGFITREELQKVLTKMGETLTEKEVDEMMEKADKNGDGKIDYEEYVDIMYPIGT